MTPTEPTPPTQAELDAAKAALDAAVKKTTSAWQKAAGAALSLILVLSGLTYFAVLQIPTDVPVPPTTTTTTTTLPPPTTAPPSTTLPPTTLPPVTTVPSTVPPTTAPPTSAFPTAATTGVPAGVTLTAYTGPSTITTCGTVIDGKTINGGISVRVGNGTRSMSTPCVTIKNSVIKGEVNVGYASQNYGPLLLVDVEIDAPQGTSGATLRQANWHAVRLDIHGGGYGAAQCDGFCTLRDSWAHDYFFVSPRHYDAFVSNGAYGNPMILEHNRLECSFVGGGSGGSGGGCSAVIGMFGDFSAITNATVTRNLFVANPGVFYYCAYTGFNKPGKPYPNGSGNTWTNNTFQRGSNGKCGGNGPIADGGNTAQNTWSGNVWDDGTPLNMSG